MTRRPPRAPDPPPDLPPGRGEESEGQGGGVRAGRVEERGSGSRRTGRRAAPSSLLPLGLLSSPPGRGEVGRGVAPAPQPGRGASRSRSSANCLGALAPCRLRSPPPRPLFSPLEGRPGEMTRRPPRAPAPDPPPDLPPGRGRSRGWQGGGARIGKSPDKEAVPAVFSPPPGSSLLPPGRGEVGRGVAPAPQPGRGASRSRSSVNCLGAPASRRLRSPPPRPLFSSLAGGRSQRGRGEESGLAGGRSADRTVAEQGGGPRRLLSSPWVFSPPP